MQKGEKKVRVGKEQGARLKAQMAIFEQSLVRTQARTHTYLVKRFVKFLVEHVGVRV